MKVWRQILVWTRTWTLSTVMFRRTFLLILFRVFFIMSFEFFLFAKRELWINFLWLMVWIILVLVKLLFVWILLLIVAYTLVQLKSIIALSLFSIWNKVVHAIEFKLILDEMSVWKMSSILFCLLHHTRPCCYIRFHSLTPFGPLFS